MYLAYPQEYIYDFSCPQCVEIYHWDTYGKFRNSHMNYPTKCSRNEFLENSYLDEPILTKKCTINSHTTTYKVPICPPNPSTENIESDNIHKEINNLYGTDVMATTTTTTTSSTTQEFHPLLSETKLNLSPEQWERQPGMTQNDISNSVYDDVVTNSASSVYLDPNVTDTSNSMLQSNEECECFSDEEVVPDYLDSQHQDYDPRNGDVATNPVTSEKNVTQPPKGVPKYFHRKKCWHFDTCTVPSCRYRHTYLRNSRMFGSLVGRSELEHLMQKTLKETDQTVFEGLVGELNYWHRVANTRPQQPQVVETPVLAIPYEKVVLAVEVLQNFQKIGANDPRDLALRLMPFFQNEVQLTEVQRKPRTWKNSK